MLEPDAVDDLTPARLRAVIAVAESGSFTVAARRIGSSQSSVSRSVAAVESSLGAPLFDRSTRSVRLTDDGREFVERAVAVAAELDAAVRAVARPGRSTPRLTVASLTSVSELHLAGALADLGDEMPRVRCIEGLQAIVEQAVVSGQATAGIADLAGVGPELLTRPLWSEPFRLAVPRGHQLARSDRVSLDDLATEPLVGFSRDAELRTTVDRELAAARHLRAPDYVVDRFRTALSIVAAGLGVMVVPSIVTGSLPDGAEVIDLDHPELRRTMGVVQRSDVESSPRLQGLVGRLVDEVSAIPGVAVAGG